MVFYGNGTYINSGIYERLSLPLPIVCNSGSENNMQIVNKIYYRNNFYAAEILMIKYKCSNINHKLLWGSDVSDKLVCWVSSCKTTCEFVNAKFS